MGECIVAYVVEVVILSQMFLFLFVATLKIRLLVYGYLFFFKICWYYQNATTTFFSLLCKQMKTGGLVVWTRKDIHVVYRGCNYQWKKNSNTAMIEESFPRNGGEEESKSAGILMEADLNTQPINGSLFERETDRLLDGLGPRFADWWMRKPLPVDADLLPEVVKGFRSPTRLCPPRMRSKLKDDELTYLRKLAQSLPTHFVLGIFLLYKAFFCIVFL